MEVDVEHEEVSLGLLANVLIRTPSDDDIVVGG